MRLRKEMLGVAALSTLGMPLPAVAATVTTSPFQQAPAVGVSVLVVLAMALAGYGIFRARRGGAATKLVVMAGVVIALAAGAYATAALVIVSDAECTKITTQEYDATEYTHLKSECPNAIKIIDIDLSSCEEHDGLESPTGEMTVACTVGLVLRMDEECRLPKCPPN